MGIGSYRHLVTLAHPAVVLDPPTWYCALQPAATQAMEGLAAFFIRGRYHPGIGLETQIQFEGRTFQVQSVTDLDERHTEIQVMAVEVVGRGTTPGGAPVAVPPTIDVGPASVTIDAGESVTLTVEASGAVPLFYQWFEDGVELPGMDDQFYVTGPLTATATYAVRVSNAYGSVLSAPAIVTVNVTYQSQVIADGAVAYWPLDDPNGTTARDLMGTYDGTIIGGVTLNQPGVTADSKAMTFNGTTGWINLPIFPFEVPLTVEAWIKTTSNVDLCVLEPQVAWYVFGMTSGKAWYYITEGVTSTAQGALTISDGAWHHLVWTLAGGTAIAMYLDAVANVVPPLAATVVGTTAYPLAIGSHSGISHWVSGALQDVAIYPRALTPAEILAHYRLRVPPPPFPTANLVSYWKLDETTGTRLDAVGAHHLTPTNNPVGAAGKIGNGCDFEFSSSQQLLCASTPALQTGDIDFTWTFWLKLESLPGAANGLIYKEIEHQFYIQNDQRILFHTIVLVYGATTLNLGEWYFVAGWHDAAADTVNIQINNGTVASSATGGAVPGINSNPLTIGALNGNYFFDGVIDEVGFWKRLLTPAERTALYNGGAGLPYVP